MNHIYRLFKIFLMNKYNEKYKANLDYDDNELSYGDPYSYFRVEACKNGIKFTGFLDERNGDKSYVEKTFADVNEFCKYFKEHYDPSLRY